MYNVYQNIVRHLDCPQIFLIYYRHYRHQNFWQELYKPNLTVTSFGGLARFLGKGWWWIGFIGLAPPLLLFILLLLFIKEACCCGCGCWFPSLMTGPMVSAPNEIDEGSLVVTSGRSFSFNNIAEFCSRSSWTNLERLTVIAKPRDADADDVDTCDVDEAVIALYCCRMLFVGGDVAYTLLRRCCWYCCRCLGSLDGLASPVITFPNAGSLSDLSEGVVGAE